MRVLPPGVDKLPSCGVALRSATSRRKKLRLRTKKVQKGSNYDCKAVPRRVTLRSRRSWKKFGLKTKKVLREDSFGPQYSPSEETWSEQQMRRRGCKLLWPGSLKLGHHRPIRCPYLRWWRDVRWRKKEKGRF